MEEGDLVRTRTQTVNRLHAQLTQIIPAGLPRRLTADAATTALRSIRPRAVLARTLRRVAVELLAEVRRLDRRIAEATATLSAAVAASASTLTELHGIGDVLAAKILARSGSASRFRSASAFASYCGVAPIEVSSGDVQRHRLSRAGDRQLNYALHVMAITPAGGGAGAGDRSAHVRATAGGTSGSALAVSDSCVAAWHYGRADDAPAAVVAANRSPSPERSTVLRRRSPPPRHSQSSET